MTTRIRQMHPFGPEMNESTSYYFTPLTLPNIYRERHEGGNPFTVDEVQAIARDGLEAAIRLGEVSASSGRDVEISVSKVPDEDHMLALDYYVAFTCSDDTAAGAISRAIEKALEPINATWLVEDPDAGHIWTQPSFFVGWFGIELIWGKKCSLLYRLYRSSSFA
jgi:hypothetical protein